jgi:membrane associated rhomboid family serine protease
MTRYEEPQAGFGPPQLSFPRLTNVVKKLIIINVVVFFLSFALFMVTDADAYRRIVRPFELDPIVWLNDFPFVPIWQLVTYGFLHSVDMIMHVVMNMLMLYFFGTMVEEALGARRFLLTYLGALVAGGLLYLLPVPFGWVFPHAIGASGACFGIMVAAATLWPTRTVLALFVPIQLKWLALFWAGFTVLSTMLDFKGGGSMTANLVHLGGIIYGFLAVRTGLVRKDPIEAFERKRAVKQVERAAEDAVRMDQLLDKIHREGIQSLTRSEREFLQRVSSKR